MAFAAFSRLAKASAPIFTLGDRVKTLPPAEALQTNPAVLAPCLGELVPASASSVEQLAWTVGDVVTVMIMVHQAKCVRTTNEDTALTLGELVRGDDQVDEVECMEVIAKALTFVAKDDCQALYDAIQGIEAIREVMARLWALLPPNPKESEATAVFSSRPAL